MSLPTSMRRTAGSFLNLFWRNEKGRWDKGFVQGHWSFLDSAQQSPRHHVISGMLQERGKRATSMLDVGCGTGALLPHLPANVTRYVGLDLSSEAIRLCRSRSNGHQGRSFVATPFESYTSKTPFQVIVFNEMLYYYPLRRISEMLDRARALLTSSHGAVIVSVHDHCPKKRALWKRLHARLTPAQRAEAADPETGMSWRIELYEMRGVEG